MIELVSHVYECPLNEPSVDRAYKLVPSEFIPAWNWFSAMEGQSIQALPMGRYAPTGLPIKLCAERGIHKPKDEDISGGWVNGIPFALSIHQSKKSRYDDRDVINRPDGTWTYEYKAHKTEEGRRKTWDHNKPLMNCMEHGVPVGVIVPDAQRRNYIVKGLAFVERYDEETDTFTLHGPVNKVTEHSRSFSLFVEDDLSAKDKLRLMELQRLAVDGGDERMRAFTHSVRREKQDSFSEAVRSAYNNSCAISGVKLRNVLQAAHIDDYRGRRSQIVQNGILLRTDLHQLYDANLLGISPNGYKIELSEEARLSAYGTLEGQEITLPAKKAFWPDKDLLDCHYRRFLSRNRIRMS